MATQVDCAEISAANFPDTAYGQKASLVIVAQRNDGGRDPRELPISIDGPEAASFTIDAVQSTCDSLPDAPGGEPVPARLWFDGEVCSLMVVFTPTTPGPYQAILHLGNTDVPLAATGLGGASGMLLSLRNVAMLSGALATNDEIDYVISNQGTTPITILGTGSSGDGLIVNIQGAAGQTLTPGAATQLTLRIHHTTRGCTTGAFTIASSENVVDVPITSWLFGRVAVDLPGAGSGRVVSSPPGIDCDQGAGVCDRVFFDDRVALTATAARGSHFNGWGNRCQNDPTCTFEPLLWAPDRFPETATARPWFASPDARALRITFAGGGPGRVEGTIPCPRLCTGWIEPGGTATLSAKTPSAFGGWSGACTGTFKTCGLRMGADDLDVTVGFPGDDRELWTLLDASVGAFTAGVFTDDGDVIVAAPGVLSRRAMDGTVRWSASLANLTAHAVALDAAGAIYVLAGDRPGSLVKLDSAGHEQWVQPFTVDTTLGPNALSALPDGRVAAVGASELRVFAGDGSTSWSADVSSCRPSAVAASPANAVVIGCRDGVLQRFDPAGAPLAAWVLPDNANRAHTVSMAFDAQGSLFIHATRLTGEEGSRVVTRLDATGTPSFTVTEPVPAVTDYRPWYMVARPGIRIASSGKAFLYLPHSEVARSRGIWQAMNGAGTIQTFTAAGTASWTVDKPFEIGYPPSQGVIYDAAFIADAACDRSDHCMLFGTYEGHGWGEEFWTP